MRDYSAAYAVGMKTAGDPQPIGAKVEGGDGVEEIEKTGRKEDHVYGKPDMKEGKVDEEDVSGSGRTYSAQP